MASSTARTGKDGKAVIASTLVLRLTQWDFTDESAETAWGDSDSAGYTNRKAARRDGTGSIGAKFDTGRKPQTLFKSGDSPKIVLWEDATDYYVFPSSHIQNFNLVYDQDTMEVVAWTSDFGADGIFYAPGDAGAPTETLPSS